MCVSERERKRAEGGAKFLAQVQQQQQQVYNVGGERARGLLE